MPDFPSAAGRTESDWSDRDERLTNKIKCKLGKGEKKKKKVETREKKAFEVLSLCSGFSSYVRRQIHDRFFL